MSRQRRTPRAPAACAAALALATAGLAACASDPAGPDRPPGPALELTVTQASRVLAAFDKSDSAASAAGNIAALRADEEAPALDDSIAAVHRAQFSQIRQAPYAHVDPVFAIPAGQPGCFLAAASLHTTGDEVPQYDMSQFTRAPSGRWKLDFHVLVGQDTEAELGTIAASTAPLTAAVLSAARRQALADQLFARTTATPHPVWSLVAPSVLLDQELAAGWTYYQQQLQSGHMSVSRTMTGSQWSACAARSGSSVIAFVSIDATDTVRPLPGGPPEAALTGQDSDMVGLGHDAGISGHEIRISRIDEFLLSVPDAPGHPATVLGLADAPVSVTTS